MIDYLEKIHKIMFHVESTRFKELEYNLKRLEVYADHYDNDIMFELFEETEKKINEKYDDIHQSISEAVNVDFSESSEKVSRDVIEKMNKEKENVCKGCGQEHSGRA